MVKVTVVGGINVDVLALVDHAPDDDHPALIEAFEEGPGGKGANQAVAAALLGASVQLLGAVGDDAAGRRVVKHLSERGVDCASVRTVPGQPTGRVMGMVSRAGSKRTAAYGGANLCLTARDVERFEAAIIGSDVVLCQLEPPPDVVRAVLDVARAADVPALLDIAPAQGPVRDLAAAARWVTGNRAEIEVASRMPVTDEATARDAATVVRALGPALVGVTVGAAGQLVSWGSGSVWTPVHEVDVVDTAGAGDAFAATLAVLLAEGMSPRDAARRASAASTLACRALGAQASFATREELERWS